MTLARYIAGRFLRMILLVFAGIALLTALVTLAENIRIAAKNNAGVAEALTLTILQSPNILAQAFPLILMLGSLATFLALSRSSEMVIVRASGRSALRMLLGPVMIAVLMGGVAVALLNPIVAYTTVWASEYKADLTQRGINVLSFGEGSLWLRQGLEDGQTVIQARSATDEGLRLLGVRLHQFDTDDQLVTRIEAASAALSGETWILTDVRRWPLDLAAGAPLPAPEFLTQLNVPTNLTQEQILESFAQPETIPIWSLPGFIDQMERAGFSATHHRVYLQSELARPALFAAMVLIGAGFSLRHVRFGQTGVMILLAVGAGFGPFFFKDVSETLGGNGDLPVLLAAWSTPAAAILMALGLLLHLEDG